MVRNASRKLKIGVQSRFYPISTVGFRTFSPENFGQAHCTVRSIVKKYSRRKNCGSEWPGLIQHQRRKSVVRAAIKKIVPKLLDDMGLKPSKQTLTVPPNVHFSNCFPSSNAFNTYPNALSDFKKRDLRALVPLERWRIDMSSSIYCLRTRQFNRSRKCQWCIPHI